MYEFSSRVRFSEVDAEGKLSRLALFQYLQDCATMHTEDVGFPLDWFLREHRGWFVVSWQLRMHRMPRSGETIRVQTYPEKIKGFFGLRHFLVLDEKDEVLAAAYSEWVLMDTEKGKPVRVPAEMAEAYQVGEVPAGVWESRKIRPNELRERVGQITVQPLDLDTNHHMNNVRYPEIAASALPDSEAYDAIRVEYKKQARLHDTVHLALSKECDAEEKKGVQVVLEDDDGEIFAVVEFLRTVDA